MSRSPVAGLGPWSTRVGWQEGKPGADPLNHNRNPVYDLRIFLNEAGLGSPGWVFVFKVFWGP